MIQKIENITTCKVICTDFFDTLVHRTVHPNYSIKLWAKLLIRELALEITANDLFAIRADSLSYLSKKKNKNVLEIPYATLIEEVYYRLINTAALRKTEYDHFKKTFEQADYVSEVSVQFKNDVIINAIKKLKQEGYRVYLITDFFFSKQLMSRILDHHEILDVFDDIFVSADVKKSKENGSIYPFVLEKIDAIADEVVMIGDNKNSDITKSGLHNIRSIHTKNLSHHRRNKKNLLGSDAVSFEKVCSRIENRCRNSDFEFSEYIIHFYFFTERLYTKAIKHGVNDLFFLAREGLYLKKIFDLYQELNQFTDEVKIKTHYLKASRQSAQKLALKPLEQEEFNNYGRIHGQMSVRQLFDWFLFSKETQTNIIEGSKIDPDTLHTNIFNSEVFLKLRANNTFQMAYEATRVGQKEAFIKYLNDFGSNFKEEGIALVDVGWGGTMQESLYNFLEQQVAVTGYYIGLKEIYNILPDTNRYGLNFSLYPYRDKSFEILKANGQLYEQLLGAPHGSTLGYSIENDVAGTIEFHEENEKYVFDTYISHIQDYMLIEFKELFTQLRSIDYSQDLAQKYMTNMAMRIGILGNKKKIKFVQNLSKGFYQNVGENKVGLNYTPGQLEISKRNFVTTFIKSPEKVFRFLVKVKPYMYSKGIYGLSWPLNLTYYYMKLNFWVKKKWLSKDLLR